MLALLSENTTEYDIHASRSKTQQTELKCIFVNVLQCNNELTCKFAIYHGP